MGTGGSRMTSDDSWDVVPPTGWEPVAEICRGMFADRDEVTDRLIAEITRQVGSLAEIGNPDVEAGIAWATGGGVTTFLRGVARCTPPDEEALEFQRLVGQLGAMEGLPLRPLITAYHVGFRELWSILAERAADGPAASLLLERGSIVWERLVAITDALADGYQQEMGRREALETSTTARLIEALEGDAGPDAAIDPARDLGLEPFGTFQVVVLGDTVAVLDVARGVVARIQSAGSSASSTQRGGTAVVVAQGVEPGPLDAALDVLPTNTAVGVGRPGRGLEGARQSLVEADLAFRVGTARKAACRFEDDWLLATLLSQRGALEGLLEPGIAIATSEEHLADALRAFARSGFSVAEAARALILSPNALRYRLKRWQELTGWDPWSFDGLARSLSALGLAEAGGAQR